MSKQFQLYQKEVNLLKIPTVAEGNIYGNYGWDDYNGRDWYGKWVQHSVRFRYNGNPGHFRFSVIHVWRSFEFIVEKGKKYKKLVTC